MSIYTIHDFFSNFCICKSNTDLDNGTRVDVNIFSNLEDAEFHMHKLHVDKLEKLLDSRFDLNSNAYFSELNTYITKYRVCKFQSKEKQMKACENKCIRNNKF